MHSSALRPEPIAIIGVGCRFRGVRGVEPFWRLLAEGRESFCEVPRDRFDLESLYDPRPGTPGRIVTREGGYLEDPWSFDNELFGISYREAAAMDPQHRLLVELAWEALEDAGVPPAAIRGRRVGVHIGMFTSDFRDRILQGPVEALDIYSEIGTTRSSAAGRIAHAFDLIGPAVTVDAACASSLVSVHLGVQALRLGEVELAIAGGVNLILSPEATICFSQSGMLSPASRCRFGDAEGQGFVRSEGAGLVVLKPLSAALRDGDRIYACIERSGVANDGRQGDGLFMTPSVDGQVALLEGIYEGVDRDAVAYVEAHGTGTRAGDPVEIEAISRVIARGRSEGALLPLGSVKTNLGHTEGAAGIAGLIKAALVLHHRTIPPSLQLRTPNPAIPWAERRVEIPTALRALPPDGRLLAGVSSFGLSGTNAHALLGTAPPLPARPAPARAPCPLLLPVSAHTPEALASLCADLAAVLEAGAEAETVASTRAHRRAHLRHRALILAPDAPALPEALRAAAATKTPGTPDEHGPLAFVFGGQGGQWVGMGRQALEEDPAFRAAIESLAQSYQAHVGADLLGDLRDEAGAWARDIGRIQPLIMAVQLSTARALIARGVRPRLVVGHSMGEVAAAAVAGILSPDQAMRVIAVRSRLMSTTAGQGAMAVLGLGPAEVERRIQGGLEGVAIAVVNSPDSTVVSGSVEAVEALARQVEAYGASARRIEVDVASHGPQMDPLLPALRAALADLRPAAGAIPLVSSVTGRLCPGERMDADYWVRNLRQTVRFQDAIEAMHEQGARIVLECGPHPVLLTAIGSTLAARGREALGLRTMVRGEADRSAFLHSLAALYEAGVDLDFGLDLPPRPPCSLPPYPLQREAFPPPETPSGPSGRSMGAPAAGSAPSWPPRRVRLGADPDAQLWELPLSLARAPWLGDHRVRGAPILPGAAHAELLLTAADALHGEGAGVVRSLTLERMLAVPEDGALPLQLHLRRAREGLSVGVLSAPEDPRAGEIRPDGERLARGEIVARPGRLPCDEAEPLLAERLELERAVQAGGQSRGTGLLMVGPATPPETADDIPIERVRAVVRDHDLVLPWTGGRVVVVVVDVPDDERLAVVAERVRASLRGHVAEPLELRGALLDHAPRPPVRPFACPRVEELPVLPPQERAFVAEGDREEATGEVLYERFAALGIQYGPAFRCIERCERWGRRASVSLRLPGPVVEASRERPAHAAILDGCLQAAIAPFLPATGKPAGMLPVAIERLERHGRPDERLRVHSWLRAEGPPAGDELVVDAVVQNERGGLLFAIEGLRARRFAEATARAPAWEEWLHQERWEDCALPAAQGRPVIALRSLDAEAGATVAEALRAAGLETSAGEEASLELLVAFGSPHGEPLPRERRCAALLRWLEGVEAGSARTRRRILVLTHGAWSPRGIGDLDQAALWGLVRVVANERPELDLALLDLDEDPASLAALGEVLGRLPPEDELRLVAGRPQAHRFLPGVPEAAPRAAATERAGPRLAGPPPGALAAGRVRVRVEDLAMTRIGPEGSGRVLFGVHGRVTECPEAGLGFAEGDEVVCLDAGLPGEPLPRVLDLEPARLLRREPAWPGERAAMVTASVVPARWAARRLQEGGLVERILVLGCERAFARALALHLSRQSVLLVAAASSREARLALRRAGLPRVMPVESAGLERLALGLGGGAFDRVVDPTGRLSAAQARALLRPGGVLVLFGDAAEHANLAQRHEVRVLRPAEELLRSPRELRGLIREAIDNHRLALPEDPSRLHPFPGEPEVDAFLGAVPEIEEGPPTGAPRVDRNGSYLITGGTGGLGLRLAEWLCAQGAGHVVLASRTGRVRPEDAPRLAGLQRRGGPVRVEALDVAQPDQVEALLVSMARALGPVRGIFHLAAVLDDGTIESLDEGRFATAFAAKAQGALNLHAASLQHELDHFVLFSSVAAILGSPGQGNYAAANALLDSLAVLRHHQGLPALSLAWGVWAETGLAAAQENRGSRLARMGLFAMDPDEAIQAMARVLGSSAAPTAIIAPLDGALWAARHPPAARRRSLAPLVGTPLAPAAPGPTPTAPGPGGPALRETLRSTLRRMMAEVTRMPERRIRDHQPLAAMGLDSLMSVELRARIGRELGVQLPPRSLLAMTGLHQLCETIAAAIVERRPVAEEPVPMPRPRLPEEVRPRRACTEGPPSGPTLLTGATGFVGAHLLAALLERRPEPVRCLVRAADARAGRARLFDRLAALGIELGEAAARVEVLAGDLAAPRLGLSAEAFEELARGSGRVIHAGAWVHHAEPLARLQPTNVQGTQALLELCARRPGLRLHHLSTIAVFSFTARPTLPTRLGEEQPLGEEADPFFGDYAISKWAAEQLCAEAVRRGLPVTVYRLGLVTGPRRTAIVPPGDAIWRLVDAFARLGRVPDMPPGLGLVPVDFVAQAILDRLDAAEGPGILHLHNPQPTTAAELREALRSLGIPARLAPAAEVLDELRVQADPSWPVYPLLARLERLPLAELARADHRIAVEGSLAALSPATRALLPVDDALLRRYLEGLVEVGALVGPGAGRAEHRGHGGAPVGAEARG